MPLSNADAINLCCVVVSKMSPLFTDFVQHDCQEFIQFFVDALHETMKGILRKNDGAGGGAAQRDDQNWRNAIDHWRNEVLAPKKGSVIFNLFAGQSVSELRCTECTYSSKTFELFTMLSLQIPIPENTAITFNVISREGDPIKCSSHEIRLPLAMKLSKVKKIICRRAYISVSKAMFITLNKNNKSYNEEFSQKFNDAKTKRSSESDEGNAEDDKDTSDEDDDDEPSAEERLRDIPLDKIDIWRLFKNEDGHGDRLICIFLAQRFTDESHYIVGASDAGQLPMDVPKQPTRFRAAPKSARLLSVKALFTGFLFLIALLNVVDGVEFTERDLLLEAKIKNDMQSISMTFFVGCAALFLGAFGLAVTFSATILQIGESIWRNRNDNQKIIAQNERLNAEAMQLRADFRYLHNAMATLGEEHAKLASEFKKFQETVLNEFAEL